MVSIRVLRFLSYSCLFYNASYCIGSESLLMGIPLQSSPSDSVSESRLFTSRPHSFHKVLSSREKPGCKELRSSNREGKSQSVFILPHHKKRSLRVPYDVLYLNANVTTATKHMIFLQPVSCVFSVTCHLGLKAEQNHCSTLTNGQMQISCLTAEQTAPSVPQGAL